MAFFEDLALGVQNQGPSSNTLEFLAGWRGHIVAGPGEVWKSWQGDSSEKLENEAALQLLKINELLTRLTSIADEQDGSQSRVYEFFRPSAESFESAENTPSSIAVKSKYLEASSYHGRIEDGGRPVCSIQKLSFLLTTPMARYEAVLPSLSDYPESETRDGEMKTVFSRKFTR
ncbi:MAG: hypothetical protein M1823_001659 [Watsoniomyces obsoletus]|nr:MAG: hypothetical protein M1823_001659 [Watsoniomyces obsoletus]